jgi:hypothetical protein
MSAARGAAGTRTRKVAICAWPVPVSCVTVKSLLVTLVSMVMPHKRAIAGFSERKRTIASYTPHRWVSYRRQGYECTWSQVHGRLHLGQRLYAPFFFLQVDGRRPDVAHGRRGRNDRRRGLRVSRAARRRSARERRLRQRRAGEPRARFSASASCGHVCRDARSRRRCGDSGPGPADERRGVCVAARYRGVSYQQRGRARSHAGRVRRAAWAADSGRSAAGRRGGGCDAVPRTRASQCHTGGEARAPQLGRPCRATARDARHVWRP